MRKFTYWRCVAIASRTWSVYRSCSEWCVLFGEKSWMSIQIVSWLKVNSSTTCLMCMIHSSTAVSYCKISSRLWLRQWKKKKKKKDTNIFKKTPPNIQRISEYFHIKSCCIKSITVAILTLPSCTVDFNEFLSPIRTVWENKCPLEKQSMKKTVCKQNVQVGKKEDNTWVWLLQWTS